MVQWLRLRISTAGDTGSISGVRTKILYAMRPKKKKPKTQKTHWPLKSEGEVFKTNSANVFYVPTCKTQSRPQTSGALHEY